MSRPPSDFHGFIGQNRIVTPLRRQIDGAKAYALPFPTTLVTGPSGVGKTHLARAMATAFGTQLFEVQGRNDAGTLQAKLQQLKPYDFLLIDEAHRQRPAVQELLLDVIDNARIPLVPDQKLSCQQEDYVPINKCTIVLATNQPGLLVDALHRRITHTFHLTLYTEVEMQEIVDRLATDHSLLLSAHARNLIAHVSAGVPRRAKQLLVKLKLHDPESVRSQRTIEQIRAFLHDFEIDEKGLGPQHRAYLQNLQRLKAGSLESLSLLLGVDSAFVQHQIEFPLLRLGLINIGSRGRTLTATGNACLAHHASAAKETEDVHADT